MQLHGTSIRPQLISVGALRRGDVQRPNAAATTTISALPLLIGFVAAAMLFLLWTLAIVPFAATSVWLATARALEHITG